MTTRGDTGKHRTRASRERPTHRGAAAEETPWWRRGWAIVTGAILTLGALASAISAVLGLVRADPGLERAVITSVDLIPAVSLSEYERRAASGHRSLGQGSDLALVAHVVQPFAAYVPPALTVEGPTDTPAETPAESPDPEPTGPDPTGPETEDPTESPASPGESLSPSPSESPDESPTESPSETPTGLLTKPPEAFASVNFRYEDVVREVGQIAPRFDLPSDPGDDGIRELFSLIVTDVDDEGEPAPPAEVARRLVRVLGETRTIPTPQGKLDPLGVVVTANVQLEGLRDRELGVFWEVWSRDGGTQLYDRWLDQVPVSRITAQQDTDAGSLRFWVPMPKEPGDYVIDVIVREGEAVLSTKKSDPFG
jgi:hypothetical protein